MASSPARDDQPAMGGDETFCGTHIRVSLPVKLFPLAPRRWKVVIRSYRSGRDTLTIERYQDPSHA